VAELFESAGGVVVVPLIIGMAMKLGGTPAPGADHDDNRS
jgi:hypothetical protein